MLELLPGLFLAVLAVLGSGFLLGRWEETGGVDLFMWAGLRGLVGIAVLALFFVLEGNARYWALVGFVPLFTGIFRYCPAYSLIGLSTCPMKRG